jgi:sensor domain CHASE-containing protein
MNLRTRLLLWLVPVILILGGVMYVYSKQALKNDARQIEEEHTWQEMNGVRQMISYELDDLAGTTQEWAGRDETYAFATRTMPISSAIT